MNRRNFLRALTAAPLITPMVAWAKPADNKLWREGQSGASVNDAARRNMAAVARWRDAPHLGGDLDVGEPNVRS